MAKTRDLNEEGKQLFKELMHCIQHTNPSKQLLAELMLATIGLALTQRQLTRTRNLAERRRLKEEFQQKAKTLRQAVKLLEQRQGSSSSQADRPPTQAA